MTARPEPAAVPLRVLVTGSSGWLGQTLVPQLLAAGHEAVGLDLEPGGATEVVGSITDARLVEATIRAVAIQAIIHAATYPTRHSIKTHILVQHLVFSSRWPSITPVKYHEETHKKLGFLNYNGNIYVIDTPGFELSHGNHLEQVRCFYNQISKLFVH